MYERLLVPVDGSAFAEEMLPYALGISRATGAGLALLRVVDQGGNHAEASRYVETLAAEVAAEGLCLASSGDAATTILEEAARVPGTLVAMTSQGRSGVLEAVLGSVAMKVLRGGGAPVLVLRPRADRSGSSRDPVKMERIVLPLDGTPRAEAIAAQAGEVARWLGARLVVIEVLGPRARVADGLPGGDVMDSSYVHSRATALGKQYGIEVGWEVLHRAEPADAIADFVGRDRGTMLAMVTRANVAPLTAARLGSVTSACLRKAGAPLLMRLP
ncbi:MAG: universal stress protein [Gammaproteobacteria bacterium]